MGKTLQVAAATAISILWFTASALAGGGSAIGFGIAGFGIGALVGGALAPTEVYVGPAPGYYYDPYYLLTMMTPIIMATILATMTDVRYRIGIASVRTSVPRRP